MTAQKYVINIDNIDFGESKASIVPFAELEDMRLVSDIHCPYDNLVRSTMEDSHELRRLVPEILESCFKHSGVI